MTAPHGKKPLSDEDPTLEEEALDFDPARTDEIELDFVSSDRHGTTWQQLADYLAVVSLAQINPDADLAAFDSILNLFSNPNAYSGLTDWDRSYIRALYSYDPEQTPVVQRNELVTQMTSREVERTVR